jgi:hypothetical protein
MNCALCKRETILVASHIIPEFLYQTLYDEKHRFHQLSTDPNKKNQFKQKGLREQLLCEACEQLLSVYEQYMSRLLNGGISILGKQEGNLLYLSELDYKKLKLFQLSVLWRASVSSLAPFSQVILGPHEERIRLMLLEGDPGKCNQYGCIMATLMSGIELVSRLLVPPTWARLDGHMAYRFVFGGLVFVYVVASHALPSFVESCFVQEDGSVVVRLQQINEMGFLVDTVARLHDLGKFAKS